MRIGPWNVRALDAGHVRLDGGAMFGVVPRVLWEKDFPPDELHRVRLAVRVLLLEEVAGDRRVLIDTGPGTAWPRELAGRFGIRSDEATLERSLAAAGVRPEQITHVLLTHLHFDHAGGSVVRSGDRLVPAFENARYFVQERNRAWAATATRDRASYLQWAWEPLEREGVLERLDGPGRWLEGVELRLCEGHTAAMQLPIVSGPQSSLVHCADLVPTAAHLRPAWIAAYDNQPLVVLEEKQRLLEEAAGGGWILCFEHDPRLDAARIAADDRGGWVAQDLVEL